MYKRPKVLESVYQQARIAAILRGIELRDFLSKVIPLGIEALEKQEQTEGKQEQLAS